MCVCEHKAWSKINKNPTMTGGEVDGVGGNPNIWTISRGALPRSAAWTPAPDPVLWLWAQGTTSPMGGSAHPHATPQTIQARDTCVCGGGGAWLCTRQGLVHTDHWAPCNRAPPNAEVGEMLSCRDAARPVEYCPSQSPNPATRRHKSPPSSIACANARASPVPYHRGVCTSTGQVGWRWRLRFRPLRNCDTFPAWGSMSTSL